MQKLLVVGLLAPFLALACGPVAGTEAPAPRAGAWTVTVAVDPMTDENTSRATLTLRRGTLSFECIPESAPHKSGYNNYPPPTGLNVVFDLRSGLPLNSVQASTYVTYRVGDNDPVGPERWRLFNSRSSAWAPVELATQFRRDVEAGESLAFRIVDPYDKTVMVEQTLDITGAAEAIARLGC